MTETRPDSECASFERVNSLLRYDPESGLFYWRVHRRSVRAGSEAGTLLKSGYIRVGIDGEQYQAHRVAHLLMTGRWPERDPEHGNRIRHDNRWSNICDVATRSENSGNQGFREDSSSGLRGVSWHIGAGKWLAKIMFNGRAVHLGYFTDLRLAGLTYDVAAKLAWGERFSCLNFSSGESDNIVLSERVLRVMGEM